MEGVNRFSYAAGNPTTLVDPNGLWPYEPTAEFEDRAAGTVTFSFESRTFTSTTYGSGTFISTADFAAALGISFESGESIYEISNFKLSNRVRGVSDLQGGAEMAAVVVVAVVVMIAPQVIAAALPAAESGAVAAYTATQVYVAIPVAKATGAAIVAVVGEAAAPYVAAGGTIAAVYYLGVPLSPALPARQPRLMLPAAGQSSFPPLFFGQKRVGPEFRPEGPMQGRSIIEVAREIQAGTFPPGKLPVYYFITPEGQYVALNTRGLATHSLAGRWPTVAIFRDPTRPEVLRLGEPSLLPGQALPSSQVPMTPSRTDLRIIMIIETPRTGK